MSNIISVFNSEYDKIWHCTYVLNLKKGIGEERLRKSFWAYPPEKNDK